MVISGQFLKWSEYGNLLNTFFLFLCFCCLFLFFSVFYLLPTKLNLKLKYEYLFWINESCVRLCFWHYTGQKLKKSQFPSWVYYMTDFYESNSNCEQISVHAPITWLKCNFLTFIGTFSYVWITELTKQITQWTQFLLNC